MAAQAILAPAGAVSLIDAQGIRRSGRILLVEPLHKHRLLPAADAEIQFLEPTLESSGSPGLERLADGEFMPGGFWWRMLSDTPTTTALEPAWSNAVTSAIDAQLAAGAVRLDKIASVAGLSPDRFRHVFAQVHGMPFKRVVLWRRLARAVLHLAAGDRVTTAAHASGFSDGAHFSRTMRTMFGIRPSQLVIGG